jgi:hypothetical protein
VAGWPNGAARRSAFRATVATFFCGRDGPRSGPVRCPSALAGARRGPGSTERPARPAPRPGTVPADVADARSRPRWRPGPTRRFDEGQICAPGRGGRPPAGRIEETAEDVLRTWSRPAADRPALSRNRSIHPRLPPRVDAVEPEWPAGRSAGTTLVRRRHAGGWPRNSVLMGDTGSGGQPGAAAGGMGGPATGSAVQRRRRPSPRSGRTTGSRSPPCRWRSGPSAPGRGGARCRRIRPWPGCDPSTGFA